jgi:ankyrin repeat protein
MPSGDIRALRRNIQAMKNRISMAQKNKKLNNYTLKGIQQGQTYLRTVEQKLENELRRRNTNTSPYRLHGAAKNDNTNSIKTYLNRDRMNVNVRDGSGNTPLGIAASFGSLSAVKLLINEGANVNKGNNYGMTPLMQAASTGNVEIVRELIKRGARIDARNKKGMTALMFGARRPDVLKLLVRAGANPMLRNSNGRSLINWADGYEYRLIARELTRLYPARTYAKKWLNLTSRRTAVRTLSRATKTTSSPFPAHLMQRIIKS